MTLPIEPTCKPNSELGAVFVGFAHCWQCSAPEDYKDDFDYIKGRAPSPYERWAYYAARDRWCKEGAVLMQWDAPTIDGEPHIHSYCPKCKRAICYGIAMGPDD